MTYMRQTRETSPIGEVDKNRFCGVVSGKVLLICVVMKKKCGNGSVLKVRWGCTSPIELT